MSFSGSLSYGAIYMAALLEGEVVFVAASIMVAAGQLHTLPVLLAGALGAATGDQLFFYALRSRIHSWLGRMRSVARRQDAIVARVRQHEMMMILALRFAPGLRIAIAAACAYAGVTPLRFTLLNTLSAVAWAASLLGIVAWLGPTVVQHLGVSGAWGAIIAAALVLAFAWWLGRDLKNSA
jgi:membrane protein DedA with SNARE-associated domain